MIFDDTQFQSIKSRYVDAMAGIVWSYLHRIPLYLDPKINSWESKKTYHIFPEAQLISNNMAHKNGHHRLVKFFHALVRVIVFFLRVLVRETKFGMVKILKNSNSEVSI